MRRPPRGDPTSVERWQLSCHALDVCFCYLFIGIRVACMRHPSHRALQDTPQRVRRPSRRRGRQQSKQLALLQAHPAIAFAVPMRLAVCVQQVSHRPLRCRTCATFLQVYFMLHCKGMDDHAPEQNFETSQAVAGKNQASGRKRLHFDAEWRQTLMPNPLSRACGGASAGSNGTRITIRTCSIEVFGTCLAKL